MVLQPHSGSQAHAHMTVAAACTQTFVHWFGLHCRCSANRMLLTLFNSAPEFWQGIWSASPLWSGNQTEGIKFLLTSWRCESVHVQNTAHKRKEGPPSAVSAREQPATVQGALQSQSFPPCRLRDYGYIKELMSKPRVVAKLIVFVGVTTTNF